MSKSGKQQQNNKISTDQRMRILANLLIDKVLEDQKAGRLKFANKKTTLNVVEKSYEK